MPLGPDHRYQQRLRLQRQQSVGTKWHLGQLINFVVEHSRGWPELNSSKIPSPCADLIKSSGTYVASTQV